MPAAEAAAATAAARAAAGGGARRSSASPQERGRPGQQGRASPGRKGGQAHSHQATRGGGSAGSAPQAARLGGARQGGGGRSGDSCSTAKEGKASGQSAGRASPRLRRAGGEVATAGGKEAGPGEPCLTERRRPEGAGRARHRGSPGPCPKRRRRRGNGKGAVALPFGRQGQPRLSEECGTVWREGGTERRSAWIGSLLTCHPVSLRIAFLRQHTPPRNPFHCTWGHRTGRGSGTTSAWPA